MLFTCCRGHFLSLLNLSCPELTLTHIFTVVSLAVILTLTQQFQACGARLLLLPSPRERPPNSETPLFHIIIAILTDISEVSYNVQSLFLCNPPSNPMTISKRAKLGAHRLSKAAVLGRSVVGSAKQMPAIRKCLPLHFITSKSPGI